MLLLSSSEPKIVEGDLFLTKLHLFYAEFCRHRVITYVAKVVANLKTEENNRLFLTFRHVVRLVDRNALCKCGSHVRAKAVLAFRQCLV